MRKKVLAGLLTVSLMASSMLSVNAAEHKHTYTVLLEYPSVVSYDAGTHTIATYQNKECMTCDYTCTEEIKRVTEPHDIVYIDYGYDDRGIHHYKAYCQTCSFSQTM